jgi:uncharacterized membrane protein YfcA
MISDPFFYLAAIPAVILMGLAKGGVAGIGVLSVPLIALTVSPVQAASITLPLLIVQDVVSVWNFRKTWDGRSLAITLPGAVVGVLIGYLLAARVSTAGVQLALGLISVVFGLQRLWAERHAIVASRRAPAWVGTLCGMASGFTSHLAHAGGPPFHIYMLPKRLPRDVFVGTSSIFFAIVNWIKVPAYFALGQFTAENLATSGALLPVAIGSTVAGTILIRRVSTERFQVLMYALLALVGVKLVWSGASGLLG